MVLNREGKQKIIAEIHSVAKRALSVVVANLTGMTSNELVELRKEGRRINVYIRVIRNTLVSRIFNNTSFECLKEVFGPTLVGFSINSPSDAARLFQRFGESHQNFEIKLAIFENKIIYASQISDLSNLPTYLEGILKLMSLMQEISIKRLMRVLFLILKSKK